jgi:ribosomal protein S18 acetylase RimI-like enzyme
MRTTLSHATISDADDIASCLRASWAATYGSFLSADELNTVAREWHHPDFLRRQISDPGFTFLSARAETGALVGVATAKGSHDGAIVSILRLYVLPEYQGQGIGSQLLNVTLAAFPNAQRVELQVAEGNPSGLRFWTKQGFRACGRDEVRLGESTLALISMERTLGA